MRRKEKGQGEDRGGNYCKLLYLNIEETGRNELNYFLLY
jgi:hypothetical protein